MVTTGWRAYGASKAALDRTVRSWRMERPDKRFVCMAVGDTLGTDFARDFDVEHAGALFPKWLAAGVIYENHMESDDLGRTIAEFVAMLLAHPKLTIPELTIVPPGPMMSSDGLRRAAGRRVGQRRRYLHPRLGARAVGERLLAFLQVLLVGVHAEVQERVPERGGLRREHVARGPERAQRRLDRRRRLRRDRLGGPRGRAHQLLQRDDLAHEPDLVGALAPTCARCVPSSATRIASPKGILASASIGSYTAGIA